MYLYQEREREREAGESMNQGKFIGRMDVKIYQVESFSHIFRMHSTIGQYLQYYLFIGLSFFYMIGW